MDYLLPIYIISFIVLQTFIPGFPKEVLLLQAGASFGWLAGGLINWFAMVLGAQVAYELIRYLSVRSERVIESLRKFEHNPHVVKVREKGNYGLLITRLIPYAPNDVLSIMSGFLQLPRRGYLIVSVVTALPYALVFAYLGQIGAEYIDNPDLLLKVNIALVLFFTLGGVIALLINQIRKRSPQVQDD